MSVGLRGIRLMRMGLIVMTLLLAFCQLVLVAAMTYKYLPDIGSSSLGSFSGGLKEFLNGLDWLNFSLRLTYS